VFSNLFSIIVPNIGKYFPGIHFPKENYFPANKRGLRFFLFFLKTKNPAHMRKSDGIKKIKERIGWGWLKRA